MYNIHFLTKKNFELLAKGELTHLKDHTEQEYEVGDIIGVNEMDDGNMTGRCCVVKVSYIDYIPDAVTILSVQPCKVIEHNRLPAEIYGGKEGGSDE